MYANLDCNLRLAARGSVNDNLVSHRAQQKKCSENSVTVSCQQVSIQHFPLPLQSMDAMPGVVQRKKCPMMSADKTKMNTFLCLLKQHLCYER